MEVLDYLQITNDSVEIPITVVEDCAEIQPQLKNTIIYFEQAEMEEIREAIYNLGTPNAEHCSMLFMQDPKSAYKILLKREGWDSFTEYFINKYGDLNGLFEFLNKSAADDFITNQQLNFSEKPEEESEEENTLTQESSEEPTLTPENQEESTLTTESSEEKPLAEESSITSVVEDMIDELILKKESERIQKEDQKEQEKLNSTKQELKGELMGLIKTANPKGSPFNISINAKDLAKWKTKKEKAELNATKAESNTTSTENNSEENNSTEDDSSDMDSQCNGPPDIQTSIENFVDDSEESQKEDKISKEDFSFLIGNLKELVTTVSESNAKEINKNIQSAEQNLSESGKSIEQNFSEALRLYEDRNDSKWENLLGKLDSLEDLTKQNVKIINTLADRNDEESLTQDISQIKESLNTSLEESRDTAAENKDSLTKLGEMLESISNKIENSTEQTLTNREHLQNLADKFETITEAVKDLSDKFADAFMEEDDF